MKLTIPISIIIASVVLVIGFFGMEYYKSYKVRQMCEIINYNLFSEYSYTKKQKQKIIESCVYLKS